MKKNNHAPSSPTKRKHSPHSPRVYAAPDSVVKSSRVQQMTEHINAPVHAVLTEDSFLLGKRRCSACR